MPRRRRHNDGSLCHCDGAGIYMGFLYMSSSQRLYPPHAAQRLSESFSDSFLCRQCHLLTRADSRTALHSPGARSPGGPTGPPGCAKAADPTDPTSPLATGPSLPWAGLRVLRTGIPWAWSPPWWGVPRAVAPPAVRHRSESDSIPSRRVAGTRKRGSRGM